MKKAFHRALGLGTAHSLWPGPRGGGRVWGPGGGGAQGGRSPEQVGLREGAGAGRGRGLEGAGPRGGAGAGGGSRRGGAQNVGTESGCLQRSGGSCSN